MTIQNRERYQPGHLFQVHTVATAPGSVFVCLPVSAAGLPIVAIAPIIAIHSSITNNEPVIVEIPMTANAKAATQDDIPYTSSARSTSVPASISGVMAVYKLAALILWVAENST